MNRLLLAALLASAGCAQPDLRVDVTLRGDGSEYAGDGLVVRLQGIDVTVNGVPRTQTLGGATSFWYLRTSPDDIHFLQHQE